MSDAGKEYRAALHDADLRVTAQRVAVLAVLREEGGHLPVDRVVDQVRGRLGTVSQQAVYSALAALTAAGLARRIEPAGSPALYEARVGDNHHHVVCRACGRVADVDCAVGARPCLEPSDASGFLLDEAEVQFWGLCPTCQKDNAGATPARATRGKPSG